MKKQKEIRKRLKLLEKQGETESPFTEQKKIARKVAKKLYCEFLKKTIVS